MKTRTVTATVKVTMPVPTQWDDDEVDTYLYNVIGDSLSDAMSDHPDYPSNFLGPNVQVCAVGPGSVE